MLLNFKAISRRMLTSLKSIDPQSVTVASAVNAIVNAPASVKQAAQGAAEAAVTDGEAIKAAAKAAETAAKMLLLPLKPLPHKQPHMQLIR